ncbi:MAG: TorF family putative porin [Rhizomicrobium sp.]
MQRAPFPFLAGLVLAVAMATPAGAGWLAATATVATDYRFRGVSQSDGHPVAQLTLEADLGGDLAAGAFVSPVDFDDGSTSFETDLYLMKGFSIGRTDLSLAAIYYAYPDHRLRAGESRYSAAEITLDASRSWGPATAHASLAWSPAYTSGKGEELYASAGLSLRLAREVVADANAGYQWTARIDRFTPASSGYEHWDAGLRADWNPFAADLRIFGTSLSGPACAATQGDARWCGTTVVLSVSYDLASLAR